MGKAKHKKATELKTDTLAQRKLRQAQEKLELAQERYRTIVAEGKKEVERIQRRAEARVSKARKEIERRQGKVLSAESLALAESVVPSAPETVSEHLEQAKVEADKSGSELLGAGDAGSSDADKPLSKSAEHALETLKRLFHIEGASPGQWRSASEMAESTFARARQILIEKGLVIRNGDAGKDARYFPAHSADS